MSLRDRALAAFDAALARTASEPAVAPLHNELAVQRDRYRRMMSVALVGRVSSGKSTLANALLGGDYAATAVEELTYNVTWLRHGGSPSLTVHFTDGRPPEPRSRAELHALATRAHADPALWSYLAAIGHIEVVDDNPRLVGHDLIDTPGLDAVAGSTQMAKTLSLLGRTADDVRADTVSFAARADALVLVFPHAMAGTDAELVADFGRSGLGTANPITAVGALTKIELCWPRCDPIIEGCRAADWLLTQPGTRTLLYELTPVAGKVAAAAGVFTDEDHADLTALSAIPARDLRAVLKFAAGFRAKNLPVLPVPAARRSALLDRFGAYGIFLAAELIRAGTDTTESLCAQLVEHSGLAKLRRVLLDHFTARADAIKLRHAIDAVGALNERLAGTLPPRPLDLARRAVAEVTGLTVEPTFQELTVLRQFCQGELTFTTAEGAELGRIIGEHGMRVADRLGLPPDTPVAELAETAVRRHAYWSDAVIDPGYAGATHRASQVMLRAYDRIITELDRHVPAGR